MKPKTISVPVEHFTGYQFWTCVFAFDERHDSASFARWDMIGHFLMAPCLVEIMSGLEAGKLTDFFGLEQLEIGRSHSSSLASKQKIP